MAKTVKKPVVKKRHVKFTKKLRKQRCVMVGSACSGMGTEGFALACMGRPHRMLFVCEAKHHMREFLIEHHAPEQVFKNVHCKTFRLAPRADVFVAGFPCQPFSLAGKGLGLLDERGTVIHSLMAYLRKARPSSFILENVYGLITMHYTTFEAILRGLRFKDPTTQKPVYAVYIKLLNSKDYGVPQASHLT